MKLLRKISLPFVPAYYFIIWLRNTFYNVGVLHSETYDFPIICVGNLSVGGTGKTPMVEYLVMLLKSEFKIATLSRGYKRKTKGFIIANNSTTVENIGDEPMQFHDKFNDITVAVDADRRHGISQLMKYDIETIILDDAFQHRRVEAGLNILLTTFSNPFYNDYVLPTGNLREPRNGAKRADIIIITKCPQNLNDSQKAEIIGNVKPSRHQKVFFSEIGYGVLPKEVKKIDSFTLVTGIANPKPMVDHLRLQDLDFEHLQFKDHHEFTTSEIDELKSKKIILTTEKDYMRLKDHITNEKLFFLPIEVIIDNSAEFNNAVKGFVANFKKR